MKIAIAGAGIMGLLLAHLCVQAGDDVTIYDENDTANCSHAAAGMLSPAAELEKNDKVIYELGMQSIQQHWPAILRSLPADIYFKTRGSLLLSHPSDQSELNRVARVITSKLAQQASEQVSEVDVCALEPALTRFLRGFHLKQEAQIDNQHVMKSLKYHLQQQGIHWCQRHIDEVMPHGIKIETQTHRFDLVLDCRGLGAKAQFNSLRAIRGELIWLSAPDVMISRPVRLLHPRYHLYIVPRPNHQYLIGASEIEAEDYSAISVQTTLELLTAAYFVHPGFAEARIINTVSHCRPVLAHHLPEIHYHDGLIAVNGLYRHGFLIAPSLAHEVMQFIQQGKIARQYQHLWQEAA